MKNSLFYKILTTYIVVIGMAVAVLWFLASGQIKERIEKGIEEELSSFASLSMIAASEKAILANIKALAETTRSRITLIDAEGKVIVDSEWNASEMDNHLNRSEIQEARVKGKGVSKRFSRTIGTDTLYVALPMQDASGITGYIRFARPLFEIKASVREFNIILFQAFAVVGLFSFIVAFVFYSRLVTPIQEMERFTEKLINGTETGSLFISSGDEVGRLAHNINFMVMELEDKIKMANEEKGKLEAVFSSMNSGVLVLDSDDCIEAANEAFTSFFGVRSKDITGRTCLEAFINADLQDALDEFKKSGTTLSKEIVISTEGQLTFDVTFSTIKGVRGEAAKTMMVFYDVTHLKKLETMRADFVANVTHEIRTPLTAILGFVETLRGGAIDNRETAIRFLDTIYRQSIRLNSLIDDLLTISNTELGKMELFFEDVSLKALVDSTLLLIEKKAEEKEISIEKDIPEKLPAIKGDRNRLTQILLNVLDNAVKYTPAPGKISIRAFDNEMGQLVVQVSDTGIGIPRNDLPRLGERFYRVDKARSRDLGGTGLGLSIVKHLMKAHKGTMNIESEQGKGTTVSLLFPTAQDTSITKDAEKKGYNA